MADFRRRGNAWTTNSATGISFAAVGQPVDRVRVRLAVYSGHPRKGRYDEIRTELRLPFHESGVCLSNGLFDKLSWRGFDMVQGNWHPYCYYRIVYSNTLIAILLSEQTTP